MELDLQQFNKACKPRITLIPGNAQDWQQYYINSSSVRGSDIVSTLRRTIVNLSPAEPTCQFFTGYSGCGKSMELLRLKTELEGHNFHVVYLQSRDDLEMKEVATCEIIFAITCRIIYELETVKIKVKPNFLVQLLTELAQLVQIPIELFDSYLDIKNTYINLIRFIKQNPLLRNKLRKHLEPETDNLVQILNEEILNVLHQELLHRDRKGLVVIVDELDSLKVQYIGQWLPVFTDPDERLSKLNCHMIYTIPLALIFLSDSDVLKGGIYSKILPMIPVRSRNGKDNQPSIDVLRQIVLARALPTFNSDERLSLIKNVFDSFETLDRLCYISGGHLATLLEILLRCLQENQPPFKRDSLERIIKQLRSELILKITDENWQFLNQVLQDKKVRVDAYSILFEFMQKKLVFKYCDDEGYWFDIHPLLAEASQLKSKNISNTDQKLNRMKDFFISYNKADQTWAEWIAWILEEAGYSVVIEAWDFRAGRQFVLDMQRATTETQKTIVVLSEDFLAANFVHSEWAAAFSRDPQGLERKLIPIRVEKCTPEGLFGNIKYIDLVDNTDEQDAHNAIIEGLCERGKPAQAPPFPRSVGRAIIPKSERAVQTPVYYPGSEENIINSNKETNLENKSWTDSECLGLMRKLNALPLQQLDELVLLLKPPAGVVPDPPAHQSTRTFKLIDWAKGPIGCSLTKLEQILNQILSS